jgi:hypothetical protein
MTTQLLCRAFLQFVREPLYAARVDPAETLEAE